MVYSIAIIRLDEAGKLELYGVFKGYPGMAGMYILKADSREEATPSVTKSPWSLEGMPPTSWPIFCPQTGKITTCSRNKGHIKGGGCQPPP